MSKKLDRFLAVLELFSKIGPPVIAMIMVAVAAVMFFKGQYNVTMCILLLLMLDQLIRINTNLAKEDAPDEIITYQPGPVIDQPTSVDWERRGRS